MENYIQGRGAQINPDNRFGTLSSHIEETGVDEEEQLDQKTKFIEIFPKTIVNNVNMPGANIYYSLNPYQGCEHGCIYCYARLSHEYWGYSAGLDFEKTILVKKNAAGLLEKAFENKKWKVQTISLSGNTDCYQPCERVFEITRQLLETCLRYRHPVSIITKNGLITRDLDIIEELAKLNLISVNISLTTLNEELRRKLEPRTITAKRKLEIIERLVAINVPVNVMIAPIIPALNDHEIFAIVREIAARGAQSVHYQIVRLEGANEAIFTDWVTKNFPDRASKVIHQLTEIHGGKLSSNRFVPKNMITNSFALNIQRQIEIAKKKFMPEIQWPILRTDLFERPPSGQLSLF